MINSMVDAVIVSLAGVTVVFIVLATLMLLPLLMGRVFPEKGQARASVADLLATAPQPAFVPEAEGPAPEVVAAIGVALGLAASDPAPEEVAAIALALSLAQSQAAPATAGIGALPPQSSLWKAYGRQQLMNSRARTRR